MPSNGLPGDSGSGLSAGAIAATLWLLMLHYCCLKVQEKFLHSITILYISLSI